jgi:hypothetical protein
MQGRRTSGGVPGPRVQGRWQYVIEVTGPRAPGGRYDWKVVRFPAPGTHFDLGVPVAEGIAPSRRRALQEAATARDDKMAEYREIDRD